MKQMSVMTKTRYDDNYEVTSMGEELRRARVLYGLAYALLLCLFVAPPYLGVHIGFDITLIRMLNVVILFYFCWNRRAGVLFVRTIFKCKLTPFIAMYLFVALYTGILRIDVNTFVSPLLDFMTFYMVIFCVRYVLGLNKSLKICVGVSWFLGIYGIVEYAFKESLMLRFLSTMWTPVRNSYRSGQYRVMGPCGHSIGYGLLLILLIGIVCIDFKRREMNLLRRPVLLVLLLVNSFLTGSRAALAFCVLECVIIIVISNRKVRKKTVVYMLALVLFCLLVELAIINTDLGRYIMMQITSVIDSAFGTTFAERFGADMLWLEQSGSYREQLPKMFLVDWLNPILGRGLDNFYGCEINGVAIKSIDNYYVQMYIQYAYTGLVAHVLFFGYSIGLMLKTGFRLKTDFCKAFAIACLLYCVNLWLVDSLATLKYFYGVIAIFYVAFLSVENGRNANEENRCNFHMGNR